MARSYKQGKYEVQNWDKYIGTKTPRYLSSYEKSVFEFLDRSPAVKKWGSEVVVVPYYNTVKQRKARYLVDIYVEYENKHGIQKELLEIKPYNQTQPVKKGNKKESTYIEESLTYQQNTDKWKAASKYAEERGWKFKILTERSIFR